MQTFRTSQGCGRTHFYGTDASKVRTSIPHFLRVAQHLRPWVNPHFYERATYFPVFSRFGSKRSLVWHTHRAFIHGPSLAFSLTRITVCLCRLMSSCHLRLEFSDLVFGHSHLCAAIRRSICFAMHTFVDVSLSLPSLLKFPPGAAS